MKPVLLTYLKDNLSSFRKSERVLAEWVLGNTQKTPKLTIKSLSTLSGVSEPSIVRFCRRVGTKGYADFKLKLTESLASGGFNQVASLEEECSTQTVKSTIIDLQKNALTELQEELSDDVLEYALHHLRQAERVFMVGTPALSAMVNEAYERLWNLKPNVFFCRDSSVALTQVKQMKHNDLLCVFGESEALNQVVVSAQQHQSKALGFCRPQAPIAAQLDALIALPAADSVDHELTESIQMRAAIHILLQALRLDLDNRLIKRRTPNTKRRAHSRQAEPIQDSLW